MPGYPFSLRLVTAAAPPRAAPLLACRGTLGAAPAWTLPGAAPAAVGWGAPTEVEVVGAVGRGPLPPLGQLCILNRQRKTWAAAGRTWWAAASPARACGSQGGAQ
eukprot:1143655-Pelagomonas_calceolata.AAC.3